jgi:glycerate-2-kinase
MVDGGTTVRIDRMSSSCAKDALRFHDAYNYFKQGDDDSLIITGPTGTNVADICITLVH